MKKSIENSLENRFSKFPCVLKFAKNCHVQFLESNAYLTKEGKINSFDRSSGIYIPYLHPTVEKEIPIKIDFQLSKKDRDNGIKKNQFQVFLKSWNEDKNWISHIYYENYSRFRKDVIKENFGKYASMPFSGSHFYFNAIRQLAIENKISYEKLEKLYFTEGEFKAIVLNSLGIPTIAIGGILNIPNFDILKKTFPNLKKIIMLYDNDLYEKSSLYYERKDLNKDYEIDSRQKNFYDSFNKLQKESKKINCNFAAAHHLLDTDFKGIDDYILGNFDEKDEILTSLLLEKGNNFVFYNNQTEFKQHFDSLTNWNHFGTFGTFEKIYDRFMPKNILTSIFLEYGRNCVNAPTGTGKSQFWKEAKNFELLFKFYEIIVIVAPVNRILDSYSKDIPTDIPTCIINTDNPINKDYAIEIAHAKVILTTPYSLNKVQKILPFNSTKFIFDEFDNIDFSLFKSKKDIENYYKVLKNAKNLSLISATPNYGILRDIKLKKENVYNFIFPNRKTDTTFEFVGKTKKESHKKIMIQNILNLLKKEPNKKHLIFLNDLKKCKEIANYFESKNYSTAVCGSDSEKTQNIINTGLLEEQITFVTSWCLYGINIFDNAYLHVFESNHKLTFSQILQFAGRTRNDTDRHCYLYLKKVQRNKDISVKHYFVTQQNELKKSFLNQRNTYNYFDDSTNFSTNLIFNTEKQEFEVNDIKISSETINLELNIDLELLKRKFESVASVKFLDLENIENDFENEIILEKPTPLSELCNDISDFDLQNETNLDAYFDKKLISEISDTTKNTIPNYKKYIKKGLDIHKDSLTIIEAISDKKLDSKSSLGRFFKEQKVRKVLDNTKTDSIDYAVKSIFIEVFEDLKKDIDSNGFIDLTAKDLIDLETKYLFKDLSFSNLKEDTYLFTFLKLAFKPKSITARKDKDVFKVWRFSEINPQIIDKLHTTNDFDSSNELPLLSHCPF